MPKPEPFSKVKKNEGGPPGHGKGLIPSPKDSRDKKLDDLLAAEHPELLGATTFPSSFLVSYSPPVLNQGSTPQCVAYSSSMMKARQDRIDNGVWFNFDEALFFRQIGGTSSGAVLRYAMARLLNYGYPVVTIGQAASHKVKAYYSASLAHTSIKAALMAYGPIVFGLKWPESWSRPGAYGIVPAASGVTNGHAILCVGWRDGWGFRFRNSWGVNWGAGGDCYIPARYLSTVSGGELRAFEAWKTIDLDQ